MALGRILGVELDVPTYRVEPRSSSTQKYPRSGLSFTQKNVFLAEGLLALNGGGLR